MDYDSLAAKFGATDSPAETVDYDALAAKFGAPAPAKLGKEGFADILKQEVANADFGTRQIAGFGTALSNMYEGAKQLFGGGDRQRIEANKIIEDAAPVASFAGNAALTAIPFGLAGNSIKGAAAIGAGIGALQPVTGDNILGGKLVNAAIGGAASAAGQKVANMSGEWLANKLQSLNLKKAQGAPLQETLRAAQDAGLVVPPSSVNPTGWNALKESIAGKIATAQVASTRNEPVIDGLVRKSLNLANDVPLTPETIKQVRTQAYQAGYEPIAALGTMKTDSAFAGQLNFVADKFKGVERSFPGATTDEVANLVKTFRVAEFDAGDALKASQFLRDKATEAFRKGDTGIGKAAKEISKAIEDQVERNLSASGASGADALRNFRDARKLMAKSHTVEDALIEGGGTINPHKLAQRLQAGKPLDGELKIIASFANNFPKAAQPAAQVAGPAVSKLNSAMAGGAAGVGAMLGGPAGLAAGVLPLVAPPLLRAQMLSRGSQNRLTNQLFELGLVPRASNALLQYAPVGGAVTALNSFSQ